MKCEEFEIYGMNAERDGSLTELERVAARQHASGCSRCASLQDSWLAAQGELQVLAADSQLASAPARLEMRLRQEFRMQHRAVKSERAAAIAMWVLATAATLVGAVSWHNWKTSKATEAAKHNAATAGPFASPPAAGSSAGDLNADEILVADGDAGGFTLLPGMFPSDTEDAAIMQVRLRRSALGAMGLPVNPETAADWVQVDLLVGRDGQPQAVRLPQ
ncbi:MAG TPA: hypothetical protein VK525_03330 [Candidatus Saccharimonadales bacterium]|nr:hypothetical protein [Candidatus Saccharimonadales bacterium]